MPLLKPSSSPAVSTRESKAHTSRTSLLCLFLIPRTSYENRRAPIWIGLLVLLGASLGMGAGLAAAQTGSSTESGIFLIRSGDRRIGTERFLIRRVSSGWEAQGELQLDLPGGARASETSSLRTDGRWKPTFYERQQQSPKKGNLTVEFRAVETKLMSKTEAGTEEQIFYLPDHDLVILDTNFFHQYALLLRQYDASRPGPQNFSVFVPQEATPAMISLTRVGKDNLRINDAPLELDHFQAATEDIKIEIWATPEGEIQRIEIPQARLEIVRQDPR